jgi:hypothetical protein
MKIEEGYLLVKLNSTYVTQFVRWDAILDKHVDKTISVTIQHASKNIDAEIDVGNLHDITPDKFVLVAGASFHDLCYKQAHHTLFR